MICPGHPLAKIHRQCKIDFSASILFVPFAYFLPDISFRIICDFQEFRMFSKNLHVFRCHFFSITESLLSIVSRIFQTFIKIYLQNIVTSVLLYHKHATHATIKRKKFDIKKAAFLRFVAVFNFHKCRRPVFEQNSQKYYKYLSII